MFLDRGHELLGRHVGPEVDDLETGALYEHDHQVLADVMDVSGHRAQDYFA